MSDDERVIVIAREGLVFRTKPDLDWPESLRIPRESVVAKVGARVHSAAGSYSEREFESDKPDENPCVLFRLTLQTSHLRWLLPGDVKSVPRGSYEDVDHEVHARHDEIWRETIGGF